jgi:pimeloyl-ACP methyl ester carboxylesterase
MTTSYLNVDGGRIAYEVTGAGPLVVCVPGMGDVRQIFRHTAPALASAGYRVAVMDLRGHGDSDATMSEYGDAPTARDLLALIAHLGGGLRGPQGEASRAIVVGNSMGAGAAVIAAAEAPDAISGLVLVGPFVRNGPAGFALAMFKLALMKPWGPGVWKSYYKKFYPGRPPADLAAHVDLIAQSMRRPRHWKAFQRTAFSGHADAAERVSAVDKPVLVVMGEKDPDWKDPVAEARWVAGALRGDVMLVPDSGHYPMTEYPETVNPAIVAFADKVSAGA